MNDRLKILIKRRFWIGFSIAMLSGLYVGLTFPYTSLFVTSRNLMPLLIVPSVIAGVFSGWRSILHSLVWLLLAGTLLFARALWGRPLNMDYIQFAFSLTFDPVWDALPQALLYSFLASLPVSLAVQWLTRDNPAPRGS